MKERLSALSRHSVSATTLSSPSCNPGDMSVQRELNIEAGNREHARFDAEVRRHMQEGGDANLRYRRFMWAVTVTAISVLVVSFVTTML